MEPEDIESNKNYLCYGHFYKLKFLSNKFMCRSVLDILRNDVLIHNIDDINCKKPNAIFIMMNPGSSEPLNELEKLYVVTQPRQIKEMPINLVQADTDPTINQIIRVMRSKKWFHIRMLNLSDLCGRPMQEFFNKYDIVEKSFGFKLHSCFSNERLNELNQKLNIDSSIYAAWGVDEDLNPLIEQCLGKLDERKIQVVGLLKSGTSNKYYHPLLYGKPFNQKKWLEGILKLK